MNKKIISLCVCFFVFGFFAQHCTVDLSNLHKIDIADECATIGMGNVLLTMQCYDIKQRDPYNAILNWFNPADTLFDSWFFNAVQLSVLSYQKQNSGTKGGEDGI